MAKLAPETRLIDAMASDEEILDRLIAHDPKIAKFKKVLNDERVARELRLADVARMLDLPVDEFLLVAKGTPFAEARGAAGVEPPQSGWLDEGARTKVLDLRPVFERGMEPLAMILEEVSRLEADTVLIVEAPFHPLPLRRLLAGRGFESLVRQLSSEHWQVAFRRSA